MILTILFLLSSFLVLNRSSRGNPMSWILSIDLLTGAKYPQQQEKINLGLMLFEIDKAIMVKRPIEPTLLEILDDLGVDAKAKREKENSKLMGCYEIEKIYWERFCFLEYA
jgi:hypothetical protein